MTMYELLSQASVGQIADKLAEATIAMSETGLSVDNPMAEIAWALAGKLDYACPEVCSYLEGEHGCRFDGSYDTVCPHYEERKGNVKKAILEWLNTEIAD